MNAAEFVNESSFKWHQTFELADGVMAPGRNGIPGFFNLADIPADCTGLTCLDVGTTNGGTAFMLERLGAKRVVAVDIVPPETYGILEIKDFLGSDVEFVQADILNLPAVLDETFDIVICWGVLYHLRDPLGGIDAIRAVAHDKAFFEVQVCDWELPRELRDRPLARFYEHGELEGDPTNWFSPTVACLEQWLRSAGFDVGRVETWPGVHPVRAMMSTTVTDPSWVNYTPAKLPAPYR